MDHNKTCQSPPMTDEPANEIPRPPVLGRAMSLVLVALAALLFAWFLRALQPPAKSTEGIAESQRQPFPEIAVAGWLNGPGPTAEELAGKVRVCEAWAWWCQPCLHAAPHLRKLHEEYRARGVVFIGLTEEGEKDLEKSRKFLEQGQITWPNGYGAGKTLSALDYPGIPNLWVVDRAGKIAWEGHPLDLPEELLEKLLAQ
jgi:thiol-disulfide isomerase/thioredoxin